MPVNLVQDPASVSVAAQDNVGLRRVFEGIRADSCPKSYNFHMHTIHSDGKLHPEQLMEQAIAIGLQGLAITDHHSINGYQVAQRWLEDWQNSSEQAEHSHSAPRFWIGAEINAELLGIEVHILAYAFNPNHPTIQIYLQGETAHGEAYQAEQVIAAIHAADGLAVLAHPARYRLFPAELIPAAARLDIDGVETFYAYNNPTPWQPSPKQMQDVEQLGSLFGLLNTCGTDTHGLNLLQRL
jgi:predicted metal-dependent phosphoesterase TrpH